MVFQLRLKVSLRQIPERGPLALTDVRMHRAQKTAAGLEVGDGA